MPAVGEEGQDRLKSKPPTSPFESIKPGLSLVELAYPGWKRGEGRLPRLSGPVVWAGGCASATVPPALIESSTTKHLHPGGDECGVWSFNYFL